MIEIVDLTKSFKNKEVLKNINLRINKGDIFGIIGKSGVGKSTLLRCINRLETENSGSIKIDGQLLHETSEKQVRELRKNIGMVFQHFSLLERQNVFNNIAIPLKCWGYKKSEIEDRVNNLIKLVGLEDKALERPKSLSGGQRQRVAIARALALNPQVLLCDEATSALDPKTTKDILGLLREINERLNITIIMVTHQMEVITQVCNEVAIIENGTIVDTGSVKAVFLSQPESLKRLIGEEEEILENKNLNYKLIYEHNEGNYSNLSDLLIRFKGEVIVVSSHLEKFRDEIISVSIINITKEYSSELEEYLKLHDIRWEVINNG
ncbi:MAG: ATP-binding cassette domain-containing protein [Clostridium sp.]